MDRAGASDLLAIKHNLMAAREIMGEGVYDKMAVTPYSFSGAIKFVLETLAKRRRARKARQAQAAAA